MHITIHIKSVYGRELIYPVCARAKLFVNLKGVDVKTLTRHDLSLIKELGYEIVVQPVTL